ncbi:MAG: type II toxin-antitoxin system VapB family antitoxin [Leptospiraceae bacterium]|jgi:antitoxin VapB|nr:type II toxin-antitoxin system VapB family antitoxin [Leptospiraceae bacterium]
MALSLKDPETDRLARKLSSLTGESITQVITVSLRERLDRLEHTYDIVKNDRLRDNLLKFLKRLPSNALSSDHDDLLYGKDGLPK